MRDRGSTPVKDRRRRYDDDDVEDIDSDKKISRHRSKDHRSGGEHRAQSKDIDRRKDDREKDTTSRSKDKRREKEDEHVKERDRDNKDGLREREKDRAKEKSRTRDKERDKERERERGKEHEREKSKDTHKDRERVTERERDRHRDSLEREKEKEKERHREKESDKEDGRSRERDRGGYRKHRDDKTKDDDIMDDEEREEGEVVDTGKGSSHDEIDYRSRKHHERSLGKSTEGHTSTSQLQLRISKMKEERLHKQPEGDSDILSWVSKSRKLEEKNNSSKDKAKAARLSKVFQEQDDINQGDFEIETAANHSSRDLAGVKVLHGLDKVLEGGAVVLTLKDQNILADGDLNEEADVLENVEIGEQRRRNEAYQAAKKKSGTYEDKFNEEPGFQKKMLPQYDDPAADEGITLDATGRFTGEAEKKLEELRKRIQGVPTNNHFEDLASSEKNVSDYFTPEEMLKFKKPKKKKSLRKKAKLDLDALEAEAVSAGLGDLGSRNNSNREAIKEEQERKEAEMRNRAYQVAYAKADEASKTLRMEQSYNEEDESSVYGDDDEELRKSLARARKVALKKQDESGTSLSGPEAIARLASNLTVDDDQILASGGEMQEGKVVFTEMEEFVGGLQLDEEARIPDSEDVFMEEDLAPDSSDQQMEDADGGWTEVKNSDKEELLPFVDESESRIAAPDDSIHEPPVGKGLSGALKMLKDRGTLKETVEWGGRNMDKKKSKLLGIHEHGDGQKEIRIERTDEYGRILTPKEAFRLLSHKFHGKGPGKMKQEKRMRQYEEELKIKRMKNSDTPSQSVERMRDAQAQLKTPYLVLSGNVKPGQTSDPLSSFATVERNLAGSLTPMLGDRKVEHFLGIKRKPESGNMGPPPSRKPDPKFQAKSENNATPKKPEKK